MSLSFYLTPLSPQGIFLGTENFNSHGLKQTPHHRLQRQLLSLLEEAPKSIKEQSPDT
jgi:hypothetical protein